ncbi:S-adenosyl-L-methionine-dependent methyltransferase [Glomus cerebriforme]|uniref:S-adenosyl-L-methionine-dependent methyltransferase n=1 Tax=Glomus cerebriforme TaxID=658196 RepID=A0A397SZC5_9GLOM|nr:S-adenosyl-L-methionine-dependent methyltransferase [Glomus cerebriforme]
MNNNSFNKPVQKRNMQHPLLINSIENQNDDGFDEFILDTFRFIGGRRYHNVTNSKYFLPNDLTELDRLEKQHYLFRHIWQGNFSAPIREKLQQKENHACVLDVGCGPGTWVTDMAFEYPSAIFIGVDISPIFPSDQKKPENATFLQNMLDGLPFEDNTFDFVYQRSLASAISEDQWKNDVIHELYRVTKPGGWIELMEPEIFSPKKGEAPNYHKFSRALIDFLAALGINGFISSQLENILKGTKLFKNIQREEHSTPIGQWGGRLGELMCDDIIECGEACKPALSQFMGISHEEFDFMLENLRMEINKGQFYSKTYRFYAQKV